MARLDQLDAFSRGDIFFVHGDEAVASSLMNQFESGDLEVFKTHVGRLELASTLVLWLMALPEPLIPTNLFKRCSRLARQDDAKPADFADILDSLPARNAEVLRRLVSLLRAAISAAENDPAFSPARVTVATEALARELASSIIQSRSKTSSPEFVSRLLHQLPLPTTYERGQQQSHDVNFKPASVSDSTVGTGVSATADESGEDNEHPGLPDELEIRASHGVGDEPVVAVLQQDTRAKVYAAEELVGTQAQPEPSLPPGLGDDNSPLLHVDAAVVGLSSQDKSQDLSSHLEANGIESVAEKSSEAKELIATKHGCVCQKLSVNPRSGTHFEGCGWPHHGWCDVLPGCMEQTC